jgi:hypothetical protein
MFSWSTFSLHVYSFNFFHCCCMCGRSSHCRVIFWALRSSTHLHLLPYILSALHFYLFPILIQYWCSAALLIQGAIIRLLAYQRYANITAWYFFVFSHVPRRYARNSCYMRTYTWPFQAQGIQYHNLVGISCAWDVLAWNTIGMMGLGNVGVHCLYMHLCFLF